MSMFRASEMRRPEQAEEAGHGLVDHTSGRAMSDEGAQLHAVEAQGGRLGVDLGPADVLGGRGSMAPSITAKR